MRGYLWRLWRRFSLFRGLVGRRYYPDMAPISVRTAWAVARSVWD